MVESDVQNVVTVCDSLVVKFDVPCDAESDCLLYSVGVADLYCRAFAGGGAGCDRRLLVQPAASHDRVIDLDKALRDPGYQVDINADRVR